MLKWNKTPPDIYIKMLLALRQQINLRKAFERGERKKEEREQENEKSINSN